MLAKGNGDNTSAKQLIQKPNGRWTSTGKWKTYVITSWHWMSQEKMTSGPADPEESEND